MPESSRRQLKELLAKALERPLAERLDFVRGADGYPEHIKFEVIDLLLAEASSVEPVDHLLRSTPVEIVWGAMPSDVGPFQILRAIGRGGAATVYRARRVDGLYRQDVAIKVFDRRVHGDKAQQHFQRELDALARLEHPNIVRLYDGGATRDGLLYIVMELVDGVPITNYCRDRQLPILDRLRLFEDVCQAVAFAHLKLVAHLDLKPTNILVGSSGNVKVLDFSIAKLLGDDRTGELTTRSLTIQYSSPEQVRGGGISTASDVYALGVNLYELLTDRSPYGNTTSDLARLTQMIVEGDSTPLSSSGGQFPVDLAAIVHKALRKEPGERYRSADALSEDIQRFRKGEAVLAQGGNRAYIFRKFISRYRLVLAGAGLVAATGIGGALISWRFAAEAKRNVTEAAFLAADVAQQLSLINNVPEKAALVLIAKQSADRIVRLAHDNPRNVELKRTLVSTLLELGDLQGHPDTHNLGDFAGAVKTFARAVTLAEELFAQDSRHFLHAVLLNRAHCAAGTMALAEDKMDEAVRHYERAAAINHEVKESDAKAGMRLSAYATAQMYLAEIRRLKNDVAGCLELRRAAIETRRRAIRTEPDYIGYSFTLAGDLQSLAEALFLDGQFIAAQDVYAQSLQTASAVLVKQPGNNNARTMIAQTHAHLGRLNLKTGSNKLAVEEFGNACKIYNDLRELEPLSAANALAYPNCLSWLAIAQKSAASPKAAATAKLALQFLARLPVAVSTDKTKAQRITAIRARVAQVLRQ